MAQKPRSSRGKTTSSEQENSNGNTAPAERTAGQPDLVVERINQLTGQIVGQAEALRTQIQDSEIQKSLQELRDASVLFQNMTENATASVVNSQSVIRNMPYNEAAGLPPGYNPAPAPPRTNTDCGCGSGCGDECKPQCCIQLYISALRIIDGQGADGRLELVAAVQAGDTWGLAPGLSSFYSVPPGTNGVKLNDPIGNFCVPCGECLTVPLHAEIMEQSNGSWLGSVLEGRLEVGSAQKSMTLRCDCDIAPIGIAVGLTKKEKISGVVEVEVSARRKAGGCC